MSYEHKQYGGGDYRGGIIDTIMSAISDRLAAAAQRLAARIRGEQQETQQAVSRGELVPVVADDTTVEIGRDIDILHERYDRITGQYQDILAQASQVNEVVRSITSAIADATQDVEGNADVGVLKDRLETYTDQWISLVARARGLHDVIQALQDKITEVEGELDGGKSAPRLRTKRSGLIDIEHKQWAQLLFDLGQASLFGTGFSAAARGVILLTRSLYERSLDYFLSEEDRIKEKLAALRDQQADLEAKLSEIYRAQNELEDDFQSQGVDDEYAAGKSRKGWFSDLFTSDEERFARTAGEAIVEDIRTVRLPWWRRYVNLDDVRNPDNALGRITDARDQVIEAIQQLESFAKYDVPGAAELIPELETLADDLLRASLDAKSANIERLGGDKSWSRPMDRKWDESQHPRADNGQFGSGGGAHALYK